MSTETKMRRIDALYIDVKMDGSGMFMPEKGGLADLRHEQQEVLASLIMALVKQGVNVGHPKYETALVETVEAMKALNRLRSINASEKVDKVAAPTPKKKKDPKPKEDKDEAGKVEGSPSTSPLAGGE